MAKYTPSNDELDTACQLVKFNALHHANNIVHDAPRFADFCLQLEKIFNRRAGNAECRKTPVAITTKFADEQYERLLRLYRQ